ncbi:uncharacterized protein LOC119730338 [Patiria miniata]|uniref:Reverse transcriptase n=1 Tax=Patiria miniata TaxID=46514 RepID=A0A914A6S1_PATMI|nr:uncharacterized protein LOC119730338 [Patiria miniata]
MVDAYGRAGLVINTKKPEVLQQLSTLNASLHNFHVGNTELAEVDQFTYLGSVLNNSHDLTDDIQRRVRLASAAFGRLSRRVFLNKNLSIKPKVAIYNAVCISRLLYGCKAWVLYRRHAKMLERFHISFLQRILGLRWWNKVPHAEIRRRAESPTLEATVAGRQLRWIGHVIMQRRRRAEFKPIDSKHWPKTEPSGDADAMTVLPAWTPSWSEQRRSSAPAGTL